jgi:uncharacterized protein with PIN domain
VSRIRKAFDRRFRELLTELGARDRERGVAWLFARADRRSNDATPSVALADENIALVQKVHRFRARRGLSSESAPEVFCDAGLGGLARWLRAAGCDAHWIPGISDAELVSRAQQTGATIITTDSLLLERRPIVQGRVRAIWVPPSLTRFEQLRLVRAELNLPDNDSRCMGCGGELVSVDKESVRSEIPPKTYLWVDDYFKCTRCGQLFWHGTHWQRVSAKLEETIGGPRTAG